MQNYSLVMAARPWGLLASECPGSCGSTKTAYDTPILSSLSIQNPGLALGRTSRAFAEPLTLPTVHIMLPQ